MQTENTPEALPLDDLRTISELAKQHPTILSIPTLRWQLSPGDFVAIRLILIDPPVVHRRLLSGYVFRL